ncbi:MAG: chloride channel protein [Microthrixaceae bacterium]|nr:chloride channel protein [Microthrixaceae bacterium]MCO5312069.1 chloride channel protein [Microthrixaceae bacterium]
MGSDPTGSEPVACNAPRGANGFGPIRDAVTLALLGVPIGLVVGMASAAFLASLEWATGVQHRHGWLLWFLPLGGAAVAMIQTRFAAGSSGGLTSALRRMRGEDVDVAATTAPVVFGGSTVSHLLGASAGREGAALQIATSLTDAAARRLSFDGEARRMMLIVALAAGFGATFGVPVAGVVFAMEVAPVSYRRRSIAALACAVAVWCADREVAWLGVHAESSPILSGVSPSQVLAVIAAAPAFGLIAWLFLRVTETIKEFLQRWVPNAALRPLVGGVVIVGLSIAVQSRQYNGLSLDLLARSLAGGEDVGAGSWLLKLIFTAVTVGSGFLGGEVTPLCVIGATSGVAIASLVGGPIALFAAVGMVATVGSALNAPLACAAMGVEYFGVGGTAAIVGACLIARVCSGRHSLYSGHHPVPDEASLV